MQIPLLVTTCANCLVFHHSRIWGIVLAIGLCVLIVHPSLGNRWWICSGVFGVLCIVLWQTLMWTLCLCLRWFSWGFQTVGRCHEWTAHQTGLVRISQLIIGTAFFSSHYHSPSPPRVVLLYSYDSWSGYCWLISAPHVASLLSLTQLWLIVYHMWFGSNS